VKNQIILLSSGSVEQLIFVIYTHIKLKNKFTLSVNMDFKIQDLSNLVWVNQKNARNMQVTIPFRNETIWNSVEENLAACLDHSSEIITINFAC